MVTVRYRNFIINGTDMSGKTEELPDTEAMRMVNLGYAEIVPEVQKMSKVIDVSEVQQRTKRGKRRGSKN